MKSMSEQSGSEFAAGGAGEESSVYDSEVRMSFSSEHGSVMMATDSPSAEAAVDEVESWKSDHDETLTALDFVRDLSELSNVVRDAVDYCDEVIEHNYDHYDDQDADAEAWKIEIETARQLIAPAQVLALGLSEAQNRGYFGFESNFEVEVEVHAALELAREFVSRVQSSLQEIYGAHGEPSGVAGTTDGESELFDMFDECSDSVHCDSVSESTQIQEIGACAGAMESIGDGSFLLEIELPAKPVNEL